MRHALWHVSYIILTRMSHRPLYNYTKVKLCVPRGDKCAIASLYVGCKKEKKKESGTPFLLDHRRRHLEI